MPKFSAFNGFGFLAFSGRMSPVEKIYNSIKASYGNAIDFTPGTHAEATVYAQACQIARAQGTLLRANNQYDPLLAIEMLPSLEEAWGCIPGPFDTIVTRQIRVFAAQAEVRGARYESCFDTLQTLLGKDFIEFRPTPIGELQTSLPACNFARVDLPPKTATLIDPVLMTGSATIVRYAGFNGVLPSFVLGDVVTISGENPIQMEVVNVNSAPLPGGTIVPANAFYASFTKSHDVGAIVTTIDFPTWVSNQRHVTIVVTATAAANTVKRNAIHQKMNRILRGVSTWSIVCPSSPGASTMGPLTVGASPMGATTVGTVNL